MKSVRRPFTLIELLVVVAIIAILAGLLLPAVAGARNRAKIVKAKTAMKALQTAISMYESDYGILPVSDTGSVTQDWLVLSSTKYGQLISILQGSNPRGKRYLDIVNDLGPGFYLDPWKSPFMVAIDSNYDGDVAYADSGPQPFDRPLYDKDGDGVLDPIYERVAVWSWGKDKDDDKGQEGDITSWGD